jgi:hypothetical protein
VPELHETEMLRYKGVYEEKEGRTRMKIGLFAADSHNFPNLPLMKISSYHKNIGDYVEWWQADERYDIVYCSIIFSETIKPDITNAETVFYGGSGVDLDNTLPDIIEHQTPDYSIYPQYDFAVGFLTRGCPRVNHTFCITPKKDGCLSHKVADLSEFWTGQNKISLLDQNLLACKERMDLLKQLAESGAEVDFKGGLDAHFVNDEVIEALKRIKTKNYFFAWDDPKDDLTDRFKFIASSGLKKPNQISVYVLTNYWSTTEEDLHRVYALREMGFMPFVMIYDKQKYVDGRGRWREGVENRFTYEQLRHFKICQYMQRWTAARCLIKSCPKFEQYDMYKRMIDGDGRWEPAGLKENRKHKPKQSA